MRFTRSLVAILLMAAGISGPFSAAGQTNQNDVRSLSLQDCIQIALDHNLTMQRERITPQIAILDLNIAYAGYDPVFNVSGTHNFSLSGGGLDSDKRVIPPSSSDANAFTLGLNGIAPSGLSYGLTGRASDTYGHSFLPFENSSASAGVTLQQPLLRNFLFDNTRLNIAVAKNRIKFNEEGFRNTVMQQVTQVELAYYDLIAAQENVKVQEGAFELAGRLLQENKKRVEVGALAPLDEKQAQAQVSARQADLIEAQQAYGTAQLTLKALLTDAFASWQNVLIAPAEKLIAVPVKLDLIESWRVGLSQRPDLLSAKLDLERQGLQLKYYRNQILPQLDVVGSYGHTGSDREYTGAIGNVQDGSRPFWSYGAVLSVPLSNAGARNRYKEGKLQAQQQLLDLKILEQRVMVDIQNAIGDVSGSFQRVQATREARIYSESALDAEQKKLENGKSTSFVVLSLQKDLTSARSAEIKALSDYNKSLSQAALKEGTTLDRNRINISYK